MQLPKLSKTKTKIKKGAKSVVAQVKKGGAFVYGHRGEVIEAGKVVGKVLAAASVAFGKPAARPKRRTKPKTKSKSRVKA